MLIEMVSLTLAVFSGVTPLPGVFAVSDSPITSDSQSTLLYEKHVTYQSSPTDGLLLQSHSLHKEGLTIETHDKPFTDPGPALQGDLPAETIVAMLQEPSPTPTEIPTPTPTAIPTATPTPTETPSPTETPPPPPVTAPADLDSLFSRFADEHKVDKEQLKRIAKCESNFNPEAANGDYLGMFQYAASSWSSIRARMGADQNPELRKNAEETIRTAAYHIATNGAGAWPSCK